jgi:glycosyltransferase involved in cell wall biosynthesis
MLSGAGGGAPRSAAVQAGALADLGQDVTIFTGHSPKYPLTPEQFHLEGCEIVSCRTIGPPDLGVNPGSFRQLAKRASEFDVIHANMGWNLNTFPASRIAKANRVPYIYSLRSHMGEYHFKRYRALKPLLYFLFERYNLRDALALHVTSNWEIETSRHVIGGLKTVKIPNAMDLADFETPVPRRDAKEHLGLSQNGYHVVCFGRLGSQKNPEFLLQAFLEAQLPRDSHLHFVGPPEKRVKRMLVDAVKKGGVGERVHFVDFVSGHTRRCWLACGDVFALPSHDENFCIAVIEAVASGTFSLVSPYVGAVEYLPTDSFRALELDLGRWSEQLKALHATRPPQLNCAHGLSERFSPKAVGEEWLRAYGGLLK